MDVSDPHVIMNNYTPAADIVCIAVCIAILILVAFSYIRKSRSYRIFFTIVPCLILSCLANIGCNVLAVRRGFGPAVYALRCAYHTGLFVVFFLFTLYIAEVTHLEKQKARLILILSSLILFAVVAANISAGFPGAASGRTGSEGFSRGSFFFLIGYLVFAFMDVILLAVVRRRLFKMVMYGFYGSVALSFSLLLIQRFFGQTSFTATSFLFPVIAMFYIMHSNPYDAELGAVDSSALQDVVRYNFERKKPFIFLSLYLPLFDSEGKTLPPSLRAAVRRFSADYFRNSMLFQVGKGHLFMLLPKRRGADYEQQIGRILQAFREQHRIYLYDYKIVIGESIDDISRRNEYVSFVRSVHRGMKENTVHRISPEDIANFGRSEYILRQLEDIHAAGDPDDRRVLVYCQPVVNLRTGQYDTAEALMRLNLDKIGLVCPDQFICLAEEHGYIHTLTEIILNKTCREINRLIRAGYDISRISVNVSTLELKDDRFCGDIGAILARNGVSGSRIAIELTESRNESDFNVMKSRINELKKQGITFYLDDFGTGYSNMERIMELPFDIIKFDRSLMQASSSSERAEKIVSNLATLFTGLDFSVLYEGVETDSDENMCRHMSASYLQGYKYSHPIPISDLRGFISRHGKTG